MGNRLHADVPITSAKTSKGVVMVVDDDIGPRESLRMLLKDDYRVLTADGALAAIELFKTDPAEAIILDIMMSPRGGIECLADIRALDSEISVIMLTGHAGIKSAQAAIRLGANDYLQKPFDKDEMLAVVDRHVRQTRAHRERRKVEQDLRTLNDSLMEVSPQQQSLNHLGMAAATLVHDLRNPLHIAINFLSILGKDLRSLPLAGSAMDELVRQDIGSIELALTRCRELTDTWNIMLQPPGKTAENVNLGRVVRQVAEDTRLLPRAMGARITHAGLDCDILFHPILLKRALGNILLNAIQAAPPGESVVHVSWTADNGCVRVTVTDNGCGISAEQIEKIGQPFQSTKSRGEGTGLGLFMAMQTVRLFGGGIHIESGVGKGTTIRMDFLEFDPENLARLPRA